MKSKRKPNNGFARAERSCRALLRTNHVAVVNIDPSGSQIMANWKSCKQIRSLAIANAIFDATGIRIKDGPITRAKLLAALEDATMREEVA